MEGIIYTNFQILPNLIEMNLNDQFETNYVNICIGPPFPPPFDTPPSTSTTPSIRAQDDQTQPWKIPTFPLHWMFNSIFPSHISPLATYSRIASRDWNWLHSCSKYLAVPVNWKSNNLFELFISSISVFPRTITQFPILEFWCPWINWTERWFAERLAVVSGQVKTREDYIVIGD